MNKLQARRLHILNFASEYDRASCVERGGTWNHGVVAGRYSAWCEER